MDRLREQAGQAESQGQFDLAFAKFYAALALLVEQEGTSAEDPRYVELVNSVARTERRISIAPTAAPAPGPVAEGVEPSATAPSAEKGECPMTFEPRVMDPAEYSWDAVRGMKALKDQLSDTILVQLRYPTAAKMRDQKASNRLFYGPGGTGKLTIVRALAAQSQRPFLAPATADMKNPYFGVTDKCVKKAFETVAESDGGRGGVLFLDEIDSLLGGEDPISRNTAQGFKQIYEGKLPNRVLLMSATNDPQFLLRDSGLRRRLGEATYVPLPTPQERVDYIIHKAAQIKDCNQEPSAVSGMDQAAWDEVARRTAGFNYGTLNDLLLAGQRYTTKSFPNAEKLRYTVLDNGRVEVHEPPEGVLSFQELAALYLADDFQQVLGKLVCWDFIDRPALLRVLLDGEVKAATSDRELSMFMDFARETNDTLGQKSIQATIDEMKAARG